MNEIEKNNNVFSMTGYTKKHRSTNATPIRRIVVAEGGCKQYLGPAVFAGIYMDEGDEERLYDVLATMDTDKDFTEEIIKAGRKVSLALGEKKIFFYSIMPHEYNQFLKTKGSRIDLLRAYGYGIAAWMSAGHDCNFIRLCNLDESDFIARWLIDQGNTVEILNGAKGDVGASAAASLATWLYFEGLSELARPRKIGMLPIVPINDAEGIKAVVKQYGHKKLSGMAKIVTK